MRALSSRNSKSGGQNLSRSSRKVSGVRYDVLDRVGEGTLFVVYRVRDKGQGRILALKALKNNFNAHAQFASALAQAATDSAAFSHPLLARIEEVGREDGTVFLLQEWLPGQSLEARLRRAPFGRIEALTSTRQIAEALQVLHEKGAVHGDLRPRQIISAGDGNLKLTDYGLSQAFGAAGLSSVDVLHDAVGYMAPELGAATGNQSAPATPASDLYALGVILYRMLAGRPPFDGSSLVSIAMRHRNDAPLPPSRFNPNCPADLEELALRLLQKNPQDRPASAAEVLQILNGTSNGVAVLPAAALPAAEPDNTPFIAPATPALDADGAKTQPLPPSSTPSDTPLIEAETKAATLLDTQQNAASSTRTPSPNDEIGVSNGSPSSISSAASFSSASAAATSAIAASATAIPASAVAATVAAAPAVASTTTAVTAAVATTATSAIAPSAIAPPITVPATTAAVATSAAVPTTASPASSLTASVATNASSGKNVQAAKTPAAGVAAGTGSVSPPPSLPPTEDDLAADKEIERKARRKHRRREALGAFLAFFWVWAAVGLLGGMVYGSYRWWVNSAPRDVKVPSYVGKNEAVAKELLRKSGLKYAVLGEVYDPRRPAGTVLRGFPTPGKTVKLGRTVSVTVSRGAERIVMPDLSELTLPQVRQVLQRAGMRLGNISTMYHDKIARGYICGQYPSPGDLFTRSESINLIISRGAQPTEAPATQLPPPPEPPELQPPALDNAPGSASPGQGGAPESSATNPLSTESDTGADSGADTPQVSRTVLIRIPIPPKDGASSRDVRVVVRDARGEHTVYEQSHAPGELIDEYVQITRAQGGSATIQIYIDGVLQKQQRV